jgi:two-component system, sensor histidine kinase and response regulator
MNLNVNKIDSSTKINERIEILRNVVIFSESNDLILERLAASLIDVHVENNEPVFHKGDALNAMYIIVNGKVRVHDGDHIFTTFSSKDFFGEYSLIDSSVRSATVTASEKTHLLRLDQGNFLEIIEDNVDVSKAVLKALIKRLRNNNILEERLTQNTLKIERQRDELDKQKKELEELNATKDKFFTIIAHDLKNPFNTVIGLSELLVERYETYDSNKIKEFITQIHKFSNNAYNLLEDLLQWAKSQTGRMEVKLSKSDVFELAVENINLFKVTAQEKGVNLVFNVDVGTYAVIDKNMISTVLRNLVSNAIKFTKGGGEINIETNKIDNFIEVSVSDTGVGMSEENRRKIFEIDNNISTLGTNDEVGTGLGLIIVREFVEKNRGAIKVDSTEGVGSRFSFQIPAFRE